MSNNIHKRLYTYSVVGGGDFRVLEEENTFVPQQTRGEYWTSICESSGMPVKKGTLAQALAFGGTCALEEETRMKCQLALDELRRGDSSRIKKYPYLTLAELYVCYFADCTLAQLHTRAREAAHQRLSQEVKSCFTLIQEIADVVGEVIVQWAPLVTVEDVARIDLSENERDVLNDTYNTALRVWIFLPYHAGDPTYTYEQYRDMQRITQRRNAESGSPDSSMDTNAPIQ